MAKAPSGVRHGLLASCIVGQLDLVKHGLVLQAAQLRFKTWRHRAFAQHHGNSAFLRQRQRNRRANAAGPASNEDDFVLKLQIHGAAIRLFH